MTKDLVMRAAETSGPFDRPGWLFEPKHDGHRGLIEKKGGQVTIRTKSGMDVTEGYPTIAAAQVVSARSFLLDGELTVVDAAGRTRLDLVAKKHPGPNTMKVYYAFDLLELEGENLRMLSLRTRKARLEELLGKVDPAGAIRYVWHVEEHGMDFYSQVCGLGLEGVMAKRAVSSYRPGQSHDWVKIPCYRTLQCVIIGVSSQYRELHLAVKKEGVLVYVGRVRHGVPIITLAAYAEEIRQLTCAIPVCFVPNDRYGVQWLRPVLACRVRSKISYAYTGQLRDPVFMGFEALKESP